MPLRVKAPNQNQPNETSPEFVEVPFENRETHADGQTFHWAHNQVRSFSDEATGEKHAAYAGGATVSFPSEDVVPFDARS